MLELTETKLYRYKYYASVCKFDHDTLSFVNALSFDRFDHRSVVKRLIRLEPRYGIVRIMFI